MAQKLLKHLDLFFLIAIILLLCLLNYTPGTILSGWDTMHPEFNFPLNISREFFGVFHTEQGLGDVPAHSQMADLPHTLLLFVASIVVPPHVLRYAYIFACLLSGAIGMYVLLEQLIKDRGAVFVGSMFYVLNLGTVQQFFVPYEMFVTQYATLPWLFFAALKFLLMEHTTDKKFLWIFCGVSVLAAPMAFAATLWYVYAAVLLLWLTSLTLLLMFQTKRIGIFAKRFLLLITVLIFTNAFWLLPNIYVIATHHAIVENAITNQIFSPEAFLYNKAYGSLWQVLLLQTFYFGWHAYGGNGTFVQLMHTWIAYLHHPWIIVLGIAQAGLMIFGCIRVLRRQNIILMSFFPALLLTLLFMCNANFPFTALFRLLQQSGVFKEAFRFPQDKALGAYTFLFSVFFTVGFAWIIENRSPWIKHGILLASVLAIFLYMLPAFSGNFISPAMRITIPTAYTDMFAWFNNQKDLGKVATLPINSPWGWEYYNWGKNNGFQGSGFLIFGIKQPLLDRDFDRWNQTNQAYYQDISYAVYSHNPKLLQQLLHTYAVHYVVIDTSVIAPGDDTRTLQTQALPHILEAAGLAKAKTFGNNLAVYTTPDYGTPDTLAFATDVAVNTPISSTVFSPENKTSPDGLYAIDVDQHFRNMYEDNASLVTKNPQSFALLSAENTPPPFSLHIPQDAYKQFATTAFFNTKNDCPGGQAEKIISPQDVEYVSTNASFCDHVSYPDLSHHTAYVLGLHSNNKAGLPLRFCLKNNTTAHCDIYSQLTQQQELFYLPPMGDGKGYTLTFTNLSIGSVQADNAVESVFLLPLQQPLFSQNTAARLGQYPANAYTSLGNGTILTTLPAIVPHTVLLATSFDAGWRMYLTPDIPFLTALFPFFFSSPYQHIVANHWQNGWIAHTNIDTSAPKTLVLVYLPQYLEYLGFLLLISLILLLFMLNRTV